MLINRQRIRGESLVSGVADVMFELERRVSAGDVFTSCEDLGAQTGVPRNPDRKRSPCSNLGKPSGESGLQFNDFDNASTMNCRYTCSACGVKFEAKEPKPRGCFKCGSLYVVWENFKDVINDLAKRGLLPQYRRID